jgi:hypothetical protein
VQLGELCDVHTIWFRVLLSLSKYKYSLTMQEIEVIVAMGV